MSLPPWNPTHTLTIVPDDGSLPIIKRVMAYGPPGCLGYYTKREWDAGVDADWFDLGDGPQTVPPIPSKRVQISNSAK